MFRILQILAIALAVALAFQLGEVLVNYFLSAETAPFKMLIPKG